MREHKLDLYRIMKNNILNQSQLEKGQPYVLYATKMLSDEQIKLIAILKLKSVKILELIAGLRKTRLFLP